MRGVDLTWLKEVLVWRDPGVVTYLAITLLVTLVSVWFFKWRQKVWLIDQIPGPKGLPLVGNLFFLTVSSEEQFRRFLEVCGYGEVAKVWMGPRAFCILSSPRAVEVILQSQKYLDKSFDYTLFDTWLGKSLLTSTGGHWQSRRKLLTPAFHFKILEDFVDVMNNQSLRLIQKLKKKADGTPFNILKDIALCVLDTVCETAMGRSVNAQECVDLDYVKAVYGMASIINHRIVRPWLYPGIVFKYLGRGKEQENYVQVLHDMSNSTIRARKEEQHVKSTKDLSHEEEEPVYGKKRRLAFLDLLLQYSEQNPEFSDEEVRKEVDTFMFAGHDTTTAGINWFLYNMGIHQDIQARVHEELDDIFCGTDRPVTMEDLRNMKYTENCIKENLRLYPPVPLVSREHKEEVTVCNYRIPAGVTLGISIYMVHRDPAQFPNPEVFDPDRFLPENAVKRHPYAFIPFSAGPRNCIGQKFAMMEMKIVTSSILRRFKVESVKSPKDLELNGELILRSKGGNILKLTPREGVVGSTRKRED
ncbi:cytochrome P450 4C1-like [Panulirus ornatus]|uniref:cytochrome P450 4C1-like n=1 Tax=Panulirus ornatus TaxID=150431 RepID=UPI003A8BF15E